MVPVTTESTGLPRNAYTPLQPGTTYTAELTYTINGVAGKRTWHFSTAAGPTPTPQSQTASELKP